MSVIKIAAAGLKSKALKHHVNVAVTHVPKTQM